MVLGNFIENFEIKEGRILHSGCISVQNSHIKIVCKMTFCMVFKILVAQQDKSCDLTCIVARPQFTVILG
jgi:hypothetical protein